MNIACINMISRGSTGKIMLQTAEVARQEGHNVYTYSPVEFSPKYRKMPEAPAGHKYYGSWLERRIDNILGRVFGCNGQTTFIGTFLLIRELKQRNIDTLHLHNLHGYCINLSMLFRYIKKYDLKVIWTLHDCWSFTGHCPHFELAGCYKWKTSCSHCPQYRQYPQSLIDNSRIQHRLKKKWFTGVKDMTIAVPSLWLAEKVKESFLKDYPIKVINNGIDLSVFRVSESNWRQKHGIGADRRMILGVSFGWGYKKGLDVIKELAHRLDSDKYSIVIVGADDAAIQKLPSNITVVSRTNDQRELAEIYSAADVFINPTREETYPTVNMEALACGTPVITFRTGGSPEIIDESCGYTVEQNDIDGMEKLIIKACEEKAAMQPYCLSRAEVFDMHKCFLKYTELYQG